MANVVFMYYPLNCSLYNTQCTACDKAGCLSNEIECDYENGFDMPASVLVKATNDVEFTGIDGYGNWTLTLNGEVYDSVTCRLRLLKIDDVVIYENDGNPNVYADEYYRDR